MVVDLRRTHVESLSGSVSGSFIGRLALSRRRHKRLPHPTAPAVTTQTPVPANAVNC